MEVGDISLAFCYLLSCVCGRGMTHGRRLGFLLGCIFFFFFFFLLFSFSSSTDEMYSRLYTWPATCLLWHVKPDMFCEHRLMAHLDLFPKIKDRPTGQIQISTIFFVTKLCVQDSVREGFFFFIKKNTLKRYKIIFWGRHVGELCI